jgi:hypothetical protein
MNVFVTVPKCGRGIFNSNQRFSALSRGNIFDRATRA